MWDNRPLAQQMETAEQDTFDHYNRLPHAELVADNQKYYRRAGGWAVCSAGLAVGVATGLDGVVPHDAIGWTVTATEAAVGLFTVFHASANAIGSVLTSRLVHLRAAPRIE